MTAPQLPCSFLLCWNYNVYFTYTRKHNIYGLFLKHIKHLRFIKIFDAMQSNEKEAKMFYFPSGNLAVYFVNLVYFSA